jgi:hypothetical protein
MPPAYVKPNVKRHKNDAIDAEAISEAVTRPTMRFVAAKTREQQSCLTLHRTRHLFISHQTSAINARDNAKLGKMGVGVPARSPPSRSSFMNIVPVGGAGTAYSSVKSLSSGYEFGV